MDLSGAYLILNISFGMQTSSIGKKVKFQSFLGFNFKSKIMTCIGNLRTI